MATHSSTLAWKIPWTEEPGRLQTMGSLSRTRLSDFTFTFHFRALEKEMATHSSVLAWRIPGTGEPGGLPSLGSHRVGHDWSDLAAWFYKIIAKTGLVSVSTSQGVGTGAGTPQRTWSMVVGGGWTLSDGAGGQDSGQACCICAGHKRNSPFKSQA